MGAGVTRRRGLIARSAAGLIVALALAACGQGAGRVAGVVIAGPACPVASGAASPACTPEPLADLPLTVVRVTSETAAGQTPTSATGTTVAGPTTDATGAFSLQLDPGRYYAYGPGIPGMTAPPPVLFDVSPGATVSVTILYGTGIR